MPAESLPLAGRMEILRQRLASIPERMGEALARTAYSANIKERRDHSCALFAENAELLAQAAHIPVHLGSMAVAVRSVQRALDLQSGDVALLNDPFAGGTHLPDITMVSPVNDGERRIGYVANRAHHADVGGVAPGSMALTDSIHDEGVRLPPVRWYAAGKERTDVRDLLLDNVRTPSERLGDLRAQRAANEVGLRAFCELRTRYDEREFAELIHTLWEYAERRVRRTISELPDGRYPAEDFIEGDGFTDTPIRIAVTVRIEGDQANIDFAGTDPAVRGPLNCPMSVTHAAVAYVFICLAGEGLPHNAGMYRPIRVVAPDGCVVNAAYPSAVAAGNVETSQRIVDVLLAAVEQAAPRRIPAASAGTMSSLTLGGINPDTGEEFSYYETIGGGSGASAAGPGESGIHTHMTNTRNTPIEALEQAFPLRVRRYALAAGSAGRGTHDGGEGIIREITELAPMRGALLADRHRTGPPGRADGLSGKPGHACILRADGSTSKLGSKAAFELAVGDTIQVVTPGAGGHGPVQLVGA
ncbi:MAG: hydantoinase B/oxoprolinase family protein [Phycisphaerae bacterium]